MTEYAAFVISNLQILKYSQLETISHFLSPREQPPSMLLDRTDDEDDITLPSSATSTS
jgi:hypothetical protein